MRRYKVCHKIYQKENLMILSNLSESMEMYLKSLVELSDGTPVAISRVAEHLGVTPVSANEMVHKLSERELTTHIPYKGVTLTEKGRKIAVSILRRQRLWERFLHDHLKIEWAKLYDFACTLEHATAPEVADALADFLGNPTICPRGNLIPAADGTFTPLKAPALCEIEEGTKIRILAVNAIDMELLIYLQENNILPGQEFLVTNIAPMQGPLTLKSNNHEIAIGLESAKFILVEIISKKESFMSVPLSELKVGERGTIKKLNFKGAARQRLMAMGLVKNESVLVRRVAPLGDPIDFVIKGYDLSLRKTEAAKILVEKES
jgi:DtxR family Mn-dependent transcriptional regulator